MSCIISRNFSAISSFLSVPFQHDESNVHILARAWGVTLQLFPALELDRESGGPESMA